MAGRRRLAVVLVAVACLLSGCRAGPGGGDPVGGGAALDGAARIDLAHPPWALLADGGGLWVVAADHTVARYDAATLRPDGPAVRVPFTPGPLAVGHGDLWVAGQVEGRRRVTAEGSYPVIRVARVDPDRRVVTAVIALPMRSNGNRLAATPDAVWVTDPAEGPASRTWRIDPATNRPLSPPLRGGEEPLALEASGGSVWSANHDDGTLARMDARTGALERRIDLGVEPHGMAVAERAVWVADAHHHAVLRVDPDSGRTVARVPVGFETAALAANGTAVWVATPPEPDAGRSTLARIDPATNRVAATIPVPGMVTALAAGRTGAWVATAGPDAVLRLPA